MLPPMNKEHSLQLPTHVLLIFKKLLSILVPKKSFIPTNGFDMQRISVYHKSPTMELCFRARETNSQGDKSSYIERTRVEILTTISPNFSRETPDVAPGDHSNHQDRDQVAVRQTVPLYHAL